MVENVRSARSRAEEGDVVRVTAEVGDEAVDPLKGLPLVAETIVANALFACSVVVLAKCWASGEAKQTQTVAIRRETKTGMPDLDNNLLDCYEDDRLSHHHASLDKSTTVVQPTGA